MRTRKSNRNRMLSGTLAAALGVLPVALAVTHSAHANDNIGSPMTAGVILKEMPIRERTSYVMGVIEAMAYARFVKDTSTKGEQDQSGMNCIYRWLHTDMVSRIGQVDTAFKKYGEHLPAVVIAAMVKKECGE